MISTFFLIDDTEMMLTKMEPQQKKLRLSLRQTRRAFTNDNEDGYVKYQFGCGILKMVGPKKQDLWPKINILKGNF